MQPHKEHRPRKQNAIDAMRDASRLPQPSIVDVDPEDPSQLLDDAGQFSIVEDLGVEAQPEAEASTEMDLAAIEAEGEETEEEDLAEATAPAIETPNETNVDALTAKAEDTGDLYGVHHVPAEDKDPELTSDTEQFVDADLGENWLETLGKRAAEYGASAERVVDVVDDSDVDHRGHHGTESGDRPVADKGSGGNGGL
jgi:hypothetical protein